MQRNYIERLESLGVIVVCTRRLPTRLGGPPRAQQHVLAEDGLVWNSYVLVVRLLPRGRLHSVLQRDLLRGCHLGLWERGPDVVRLEVCHGRVIVLREAFKIISLQVAVVYLRNRKLLRSRLHCCVIRRIDRDARSLLKEVVNPRNN